LKCKIFILDKYYNVTNGFTQQQVEQRINEMKRLEMRGENICYTPLSHNKHHILINDMDYEKLKQFISDGYKPAVVIESSPKNYQAIVTIQRLDTEFDQKIGNQLSKKLNNEYGDPKLSSCIHPHRAPGFQNRNPKHQHSDGTYPIVHLRKAERRECFKTFEISKQINSEYIKETKLIISTNILQVEQRSNAIHAYQQHYHDILKYQRYADIDWSRIDSMIAMRMRVTNHTKTAIETAICQCAPLIRQRASHHNWTDYAQRTAHYVFSSEGDLKIQKLGKYCQQWKTLEQTGRDHK
jgi:hypothetical protein